MDKQNLFQSNGFKTALWIIAIIIIILLVFAVGMFIGFQKAGFSYQWGENYHNNFAGPRGGFGHEMMGRDFIDGHGTFGQIIKIDGQALVVKGSNEVEKIILIGEKTVINRFRDAIKTSDLNIDDNIVVIGDPNASGQIEAKLIRVLPPPPDGFSSTTPSSSMPLPPPPMPGRPQNYNNNLK